MKLPNGSTLIDATATHNAEEWHAARREHLGGSDIASIMGVGWRSPLEVYGEKIGLLESAPGDRRMESAQFLEPAIASWFEQHATDLHTEPTGALIGPGLMMSTPDRLILGPDNIPLAILEIKAPGAHKLADWVAGEDGQPRIPEYAIIQTSWYMLHWQLEQGAVQPLIGGVFGDAAWLTRDADFEAHMMEAAEDFWKNFVLKQIEPPATGTPACRRAILAMHPEHTEDIRVATEAECEMMREFRRLDEAAKINSEKLETVKNLVRQAIGSDLGIVSADGKVTLRKSKDGTSVDWEGMACEYRLILQRVIKKYPDAFDMDKDVWGMIDRFSKPKPGSRRLLPKWATRK